MLTACTHELPVWRERLVLGRNVETTRGTSLKRDLAGDLAVRNRVVDSHRNDFLVVKEFAGDVGDLAGELLLGRFAHCSSFQID